MKNRLLTKRNFIPQEWYQVGKDKKMPESDNKAISLFELNGQQLIAQYYHNKYDSNISFLLEQRKQNVHFDFTTTHPDDEDYHIDTFKESIEIVIHALCSDKDIKNKKENYRKTFLLTQKIYLMCPNENEFSYDTGIHVFPIIYLRENGVEAFLVADTAGVNKQNIGIIHALERISKLKVYVVEDPHQADHYSCCIDAFVVSRDGTGKRNNKYIIRDLLAYLEKNSKTIIVHDVLIPAKNPIFSFLKNPFGQQIRFIDDKKNCNAAYLPNVLLKTSQISQFTNKHSKRNNDQDFVHRKKTLKQFRTAYSIQGKGHIVSTYARKKGIKIAEEIIPMQFWINAMEDLIGSPMDATTRNHFIAKAKSTLKNAAPGDDKIKLLKKCAINFFNKTGCLPMPGAVYKKPDPRDFHSEFEIAIDRLSLGSYFYLRDEVGNYSNLAIPLAIMLTISRILKIAAPILGTIMATGMEIFSIFSQFCNTPQSTQHSASRFVSFNYKG